MLYLQVVTTENSLRLALTKVLCTWSAKTKWLNPWFCDRIVIQQQKGDTWEGSKLFITSDFLTAVIIYITDFLRPWAVNVCKFLPGIRWLMPQDSNLQVFFLPSAQFTQQSVSERQAASTHTLLHDIKKRRGGAIQFSYRLASLRSNQSAGLCPYQWYCPYVPLHHAAVHATWTP